MWSDTLSLIAPFEWHGNAKKLSGMVLGLPASE